MNYQQQHSATNSNGSLNYQQQAVATQSYTSLNYQPQPQQATQNKAVENPFAAASKAHSTVRFERLCRLRMFFFILSADSSITFSYSFRRPHHTTFMDRIHSLKILSAVRLQLSNKQQLIINIRGIQISNRYHQHLQLIMDIHHRVNRISINNTIMGIKQLRFHPHHLQVLHREQCKVTPIYRNRIRATEIINFKF